MSLELHTLICSTRPGRIGPAVAGWFHALATRHAGFDARLVDLADFQLPVFDEPAHPRLQQYEHAHTKRWAASVAAADAYVFVTPEYNHMPPPAFSNALDFVYREWNYKPCAFLSYGGGSGGVRAVQALLPHVAMLRMMPIPESVAVQSARNHIDTAGHFTSDETLDASVRAMLDELQLWGDALQPVRA